MAIQTNILHLIITSGAIGELVKRFQDTLSTNYPEIEEQVEMFHILCRKMLVHCFPPNLEVKRIVDDFISRYHNLLFDDYPDYIKKRFKIFLCCIEKMGYFNSKIENELLNHTEVLTLDGLCEEINHIRIREEKMNRLINVIERNLLLQMKREEEAVALKEADAVREAEIVSSVRRMVQMKREEKNDG